MIARTLTAFSREGSTDAPKQYRNAHEPTPKRFEMVKRTCFEWNLASAINAQISLTSCKE